MGLTCSTLSVTDSAVIRSYTDRYLGSGGVTSRSATLTLRLLNRRFSLSSHPKVYVEWFIEQCLVILLLSFCRELVHGPQSLVVRPACCYSISVVYRRELFAGQDMHVRNIRKCIEPYHVLLVCLTEASHLFRCRRSLEKYYSARSPAI